MEDDTAKQLVKETFSEDFEQERYTKFARELLNDFKLDVKKRVPWTAFENYVDHYETFGTYTDPKKSSIEVIAVKLKRHTSRDRARTMQRNFIAKYLETGCDAALVAFYGDDPTDWRFSFVKLEHVLEKGEKKTKTLEKLTPVKRYSFLVGKNEPNHTCQKQFLELIKRNSQLTIEEIENAFSVDNVTEEFFDDYKDRYLELKETLDRILKTDSKTKREFEDKSIDTVDFAKKLLGQIVFLYFLQKKGWLGVGKNTQTNDFEAWGSGPKDFLRRLYNGGVIKYDNFFNEVLEPLFYEALAKQRDEDYYSKFKCKIPFLDGGLFEPLNNYDWTKARIPISNQVIGKILDTFDRFNFTVKEDEPLEKEVAVDPEMLGKVFEKMLEIKDRKSGGKYYTPREIVNYMCRQSLITYMKNNTNIDKESIELFMKIDNDELIPEAIKIKYLEIDNLLKDIKIVDPAIGSGAFPVGMMLEIVKARGLLTHLFNTETQELRTNYYLKRETIENCIYGVDIDFSAVEIAKLRFWLSLVVDEDNLNNVKPLPNLDHKLMVGNSLIEEFNGIKLFDERLLGSNIKNNEIIKKLESEITALQIEKGLVATGKQKGDMRQIDSRISVLRSKINKATKTKEEKIPYKLGSTIKESHKKLVLLRKLQKQLFDAKDRNEKGYYKHQIDAIEWELILQSLKEQGNEITMKDLAQFQRNRAKPFFIWKLYFEDVFRRENPGFDIIIANPPYVGEKGHKELFRPIKNCALGRRYYEGKMDLFYFFFHLAIDLGRQKSTIAFITTNYYPTATGAFKLREHFKNAVTINNIINFGELRIFKSALGQHNMITILSKENDKLVNANTSITNRKGVVNQEILNTILGGGDKETEYYNVPQSSLYEGKDLQIRLSGSASATSSDPIQKILNKLTQNTVLLGTLCNVNQGIVSSADKVSPKHLNKFKIEANVGEGIFVLTKEEVNQISLSAKDKEILKPWFKNSNVKKWHTKNETSEFIIFADKRKRNLEGNKLKDHLLKFKRILDKSTSNSPYLHRPRDINFEGPKLVAPQRSKLNIFGYNDKPWYASADVYFITTKEKSIDLKYILGLLNSKLYYLWLYYKGKRKGEQLELYQVPLSNIPIKIADKITQHAVANLVNKAIEISTKLNLLDSNELSDADSVSEELKRIEKEIDEHVYKIYGVTEEEKKLISKY